MHGFHLVRTHLGVVFQGQSVGKVKSATQLYKSADTRIKSLTFYPVHGFHLVRTQLGVVFHGQSIGKVKSAVQMYKSADIK